MKVPYRPQVLAILPGFIPSTIINVVKPLKRLHETGQITARITLESLIGQNTIKDADLVIFCRNTEPRYSHILNQVLSQNIPYIYDLDDNFLELPLDSELGRYHRNPDRIAMLTRYLQTANLVRTYSEPLYEKFHAFHYEAKKVSGLIDWNLISRTKKNSEKTKIIFATARVYDDMAEIFMPALFRVMKKYKSRLEIHFWGVRPISASDLPNVFLHPLISDYDKYFRRFSSAGFDIGLAPLKDEVFYRSKTNIKFREYAACRVAGIYSNMDVYSSCIRDAETGLLVSNDPESWYQAIARLVEDSELQEKIKANAFEYVRQNYPAGDFERVWLDQIKNVLGEKDKSYTSSSMKKAHIIQQEDIGGIQSFSDCKIKSNEGLIIRKFNNLFHHLKQYGFHLTFWLVRRSLYNYWMVAKLRLLTLRVGVLFWRK